MGGQDFWPPICLLNQIDRKSVPRANCSYGGNAYVTSYWLRGRSAPVVPRVSMPTYLLTYDLKWADDTPYDEFRNAAAAFGWFSWMLGDDQEWYQLPSTTLVGEFASEEAAEAILFAARDAAAAATGRPIVFQKWVIVAYSTARFTSDHVRPAVSAR